MFLKKASDVEGFANFNYYPNGNDISVVSVETEIGAYSQYEDGKVFYKKCIVQKDELKEKL